jgi:outer membrane biosynthesis protein TonB
MSHRVVLLSSTILAGSFLSSSILSPITQTDLFAQERAASTSGTQADAAGKRDIYKIGEDVSAPVLIHSQEPLIPTMALKKNLAAKVLVNCYVEIDGKPSNVHAIRIDLSEEKGPTGSVIANGLENSAVDTVKHYRFKPAMRSGKPVRVELNVTVSFQLY